MRFAVAPTNMGISGWCLLPVQDWDSRPEDPEGKLWRWDPLKGRWGKVKRRGGRVASGSPARTLGASPSRTLLPAEQNQNLQAAPSNVSTPAAHTRPHILPSVYQFPICVP